MRAAPAPTPTPTGPPMMSDFINIIKNISLPFMNNQRCVTKSTVEIDGCHVDGHIQLHAVGASFPAQKEEQKRFFSHRFLRLNDLHILWLNTQ